MPDGVVKHLHVIAIRSGIVWEVEFVGAVMDVTVRKQAGALVAGEKRLLEMIARGSALAPRSALCRFGEEILATFWFRSAGKPNGKPCGTGSAQPAQEPRPLTAGRLDLAPVLAMPPTGEKR
jgi:hypothetical protein